ncbi:dimethylargininase [Kribbella aluminosa]|uniref:Dimethylargininase n=1 Tax=Kribbella aluminosa TaxID=416017 RepID=A0ABS4UN19_9ACTN|nr:dimethylargininase [Kribbella aluminosa]MBP2353048.1 dimethylargininase [Kribbella aluminosa]
MQKALVRRPSSRLADGLVTHVERQPVHVGLARRQWQAYVDALHGAGWTTVEVPSIDECPDGVFVEDTMVVYGDVAVIARAGAMERRAEAAAAAETVAAQGYRVVPIVEPGTLDGGDVLKIGSTIYVGQGGRTNAAGIAQLRAALAAPAGSAGAARAVGEPVVRGVPVSKVLHLKSAVTALPDGTVIGYEPLVDDPGAFGSFRAVPEEAGAHVVLLDDDRLLMAASAPKSAELFAGLGYTPVVVDISEFEKLEGCVTCLSVRLRG